MNDFIMLIRAKQYIKNLIIFAPLFFSFSFYNLLNVLTTVLAFIAFSLAASGVYIINDIYDIKEDQNHPEKKMRPIASGIVKVEYAWIISVLLLCISAIMSYMLNHIFLIIVLGYIIINIFYSIWLKHVSILDIVIIAIGFILRVLAGGIVCGIYISMWIILMTFLLAIFLGLAKRREDVVLFESGHNTRKNINGYNLEFVNAAMVLMGAVIIVSYILYTVSQEVQNKFNSTHLYLTSFFVILGILRYMQITFVGKNSGNPTILLYTDKSLQIIIILWIITFYLIVTI